MLYFILFLFEELGIEAGPELHAQPFFENYIYYLENPHYIARRTWACISPASASRGHHIWQALYFYKHLNSVVWGINVYGHGEMMESGFSIYF